MVAKFLIYLSGNIYFQHSHLFFSSQHVCCSPSFKNLSSIRKESVILFGPKYLIFYFNNIRFFIQKKRCFLKIAVPEFYNIKKRLSILAKSLKNKNEHELFHMHFQEFCLLFRNTYLREYL